MISLLYHSLGAVDHESPDYFVAMATLLSECFGNNMRAGITGVLSVHADRFLQVIEGPEEAVDTTFARIAADPRHHDIHVIARLESDERRFGQWSMAFIGPPVSLGSVFDMVDEHGHATVPDPAAIIEKLANKLAL